jgi:hypothetical protein
MGGGQYNLIHTMMGRDTLTHGTFARQQFVFKSV